MNPLPGDVFAAGQVSLSDLQSLSEQGISTIINNRPDFEAPMQPLAEDLARAAAALGLNYVYIPISGGVTLETISASCQAYAELPRPIVAFCTSGTRSAALWAFAHVNEMGVDAVLGAVRKAGYDLEKIRMPLESFC